MAQLLDKLPGHEMAGGRVNDELRRQWRRGKLNRGGRSERVGKLRARVSRGNEGFDLGFRGCLSSAGGGTGG